MDSEHIYLNKFISKIVFVNFIILLLCLSLFMAFLFAYKGYLINPEMSPYYSIGAIFGNGIDVKGKILLVVPNLIIFVVNIYNLILLLFLLAPIKNKILFAKSIAAIIGLYLIIIIYFLLYNKNKKCFPPPGVDLLSYFFMPFIIIPIYFIIYTLVKKRYLLNHWLLLSNVLNQIFNIIIFFFNASCFLD